METFSIATACEEWQFISIQENGLSGNGPRPVRGVGPTSLNKYIGATPRVCRYLPDVSSTVANANCQSRRDVVAAIKS
jgi:hypothetical protein